MRSRSMPSKAQLRSMGRMLRGVPFRMSYFPISSRRPLSARHLTVACKRSMLVNMLDTLPASQAVPGIVRPLQRPCPQLSSRDDRPCCGACHAKFLEQAMQPTMLLRASQGLTQVLYIQSWRDEG